MLSGGEELLCRMLHFDPSKRCSAKEALLSPVFRSLERCARSKDLLSRKGCKEMKYMHYFRPLESGGIASLPIV